MLALNDHQQQGTSPIVADQVVVDPTTKQELTKGLLTIFTNQPKRSSGHQLHFENRQVLEAVFLCKPVEIAKGTILLGIEMEIDYVKVKNIRDFLVRVNEGHSSVLADTFTFNPTEHCFQNETNAVIQQLMQVVQDEQAYVSAMSDPIADTFASDQLLIPPSSWEQLLPLLAKAPVVKVENEGETFPGLVLKEELLPLKFVFATSGNGGFQLRIKGLTHLILLEPYNFVLYKSKFIRMDETNCNRLAELKIC